MENFMQSIEKFIKTGRELQKKQEDAIQEHVQPLVNQLTFLIRNSSMSLQQIAGKGKLSVKTVSNIMYGVTRSPQMLTIQKLAKVFNKRLVLRN
jgi:hypothetical protein